MQDTVDFGEPAFYPEMPFTSLARSDERSLGFDVGGIGGGIDTVLNLLPSGASLVALTLPPRRFGADEVDEELAATMSQIVDRLFHRRAKGEVWTP